jgi:hypothetical protein
MLIADGKITGGVLLGYPLDAQNVTAAVRERANVSRCLDDPEEGDWSVLASLT